MLSGRIAFGWAPTNVEDETDRRDYTVHLFLYISDYHGLASSGENSQFCVLLDPQNGGLSSVSQESSQPLDAVHRPVFFFEH